MNKLINIIFVLSICFGPLISSCSDNIDPEITENDFDRLFSPVDLDARVYNQTSVRLTWKTNSTADSFTLELFTGMDLTGTPVKTITGITNNEIPYSITGLDGATQYSVRIKAISENIPESKWTNVSFKTDEEQIFEQIDSEDLGATWVILRWTAGEFATTIKVVDNSTGEVVIDHPVTTEEIENGVVRIEGLEGLTDYSATLLNGEKIRGTRNFTTKIDLGDAIIVEEGDDLKEKLEAASDGDKFALMPGVYTCDAVTLTSSISIVSAYPEEPATVYSAFNLEGNISLSLKDLILDGTATEKNRARTIVFNSADSNFSLNLESCEIRNYIQGITYLDVQSVVTSYIINNCIIHDIDCSGGDMLDFRKGPARELSVTNTTFYNLKAGRDFIRMDNDSYGVLGGTSNIVIDHCTLYGATNDTARRFFYVRWTGATVSFTNNIIANTDGCLTDVAALTISQIGGNNYSSAPYMLSDSPRNGARYDTSSSFTILDPGFANVANGDFTIGNADLRINGTGDPRWLQ